MWLLEPKFADLRTLHVVGFIQVALQTWRILGINYEEKLKKPEMGLDGPSLNWTFFWKTEVI